MTNTPSSYDDNEKILSSKGPMYQALMDKFNQSVDGQAKAKAKFAEALLDINNDFDGDDGPLKIMVLSWPEALQKIALVEATAEYLLGDSGSYFYENSQENPERNPLLWTVYTDVITDTKTNKNTPPQQILVPTYLPATRSLLLEDAKNNNTLHKLSQKYEGFGILYFDNIDTMNDEVREQFLQMIKKNINTLTLTTPQGGAKQYPINFNNTLIILGYNNLPEDTPEHHVGFKTSSTTKTTTTDKAHIINSIGKHHMDLIDEIIPFDYLNTEEKNQYIDRLRDTLQGDIQEKYEGKIRIDLSPELLENFKTEIKGIDTDTSIISRKWKKNVVSKVGSLLKNNKNLQADYHNITISLNEDGSLMGKPQKPTSDDTQAII